MADNNVKDILKSCFLVGYWLGKAGAEEHQDNYCRQKDLTIQDFTTGLYGF